jgi:hypothetical protein
VPVIRRAERHLVAVDRGYRDAADADAPEAAEIEVARIVDPWDAPLGEEAGTVQRAGRTAIPSAA